MHPIRRHRHVEAARKRFSLALLAVGVIPGSASQQTLPERKQVLPAWAVCMNLMVAANAFGFASIWLTG